MTDLQGVGVGAHALGEFDPIAGETLGHQPLGHRAGRCFAVPVTGEGDQHPLDLRRPKRSDQILRQRIGTVSGGDVAKAADPEGHRVDERSGEDHLALATGEGFPVPDTARRAGQVQVGRCARAQVVPDLPAVDLDDLAVVAEDRDDKRAIEMLVARGAVKADALQLTSDRGARLAVLLGQSQAQRAVGIAEAEAVDQFAVDQALGFEEGQGFRGLLEGVVVVADHLSQQDIVRYLRSTGKMQCGTSM